MNTLKYLLVLLITAGYGVEAYSQTTPNNEVAPASETSTDASSEFTLQAENTQAEAPTTIDVLVLYSPAAAALYENDPSARIEHIFSTSNAVYENSGLEARLALVGMEAFPLDDTLPTIDVLAGALHDEALKQRRDDTGADVVILYRPNQRDGTCGIAFMGGEASRSELAMAHVSIDCGVTTTVHEIGHIMGLGHSHRQSSQGIEPYAVGYGVDTAFTTIMAYPSFFLNAPGVLNFSSPELLCVGLACGIPSDQPEPADAVLALITTQKVVSQYREHVAIIVVEPEKPPPLSAVEIAQQAYEQQQLIYEQTRADLITAKNQLRDTYFTQRDAFITYLLARKEQLVLEIRIASGEDISMEEQEASTARFEAASDEYFFAKDRRAEALTVFRTQWFDHYLPSLKTLADLRLTYLIEQRLAVEKVEAERIAAIAVTATEPDNETTATLSPAMTTTAP